MKADIDPPQLADAFGRALLDMLAGAADPIVIERDDGLVSIDTFDYLGGLTERDQWALDRAGGRVLDVGAGAGRGSLLLQERGQEVTALDVSPGAIEVCRKRGVRNVYTGSVQQAVADGMAGEFDSVLMLGNNLGLLATAGQAGSYLAELGKLLRPGGVIVGTCLDAYATDQQVHFDYHERNRRRGRMAGQATIRVRYQRLATDWFDVLWLSPDELAALARSAGWQITDLLPGALYAVVLTRTGHIDSAGRNT
jgi:SAM-dependent methyltransferase